MRYITHLVNGLATVDTDIHGYQRMNPNNAGDPLTFSRVEFVVQSEISQNLGWVIMYFGADILVVVHFGDPLQSKNFNLSNTLG